MDISRVRMIEHECHFLWRGQYLVMLEFHFSWQVHYKQNAPPLCNCTIADLKAGGTSCHVSLQKLIQRKFSLKTTSALRRRSEGYASTSAVSK